MLFPHSSPQYPDYSQPRSKEGRAAGMGVGVARNPCATLLPSRYLRYLLGNTSRLESFKQYSERIEEGSFIGDFEKIMQDVALTNLFKCSTRNEQQKLFSADVSVCVERYFLPEVKLLKPKVILAFGNEVDNFLIRLGLHEHLPPIIKIKHPSRSYGKKKKCV